MACIVRVVVILFALQTAAAAQIPQIETPIAWSLAATENASAVAGGRLELTLTAAVSEGWHLHSTAQPPGGPMATQITVPTKQLFVLGGPPVSAVPPKREFDPNFGIETEFYEQTVASFR